MERGEEARGPHGFGQWEAFRGSPLGLEAALRGSLPHLCALTELLASAGRKENAPVSTSWVTQAGSITVGQQRHGLLTAVCLYLYCHFLYVSSVQKAEKPCSRLLCGD